MSKFKVYQINLTDDEVNTINETGDHFAIPKGRARMDSMLGDFSTPNWTFYDHVADIEAMTLNEVFHFGNVGPEEKITRHAPMHSLSVGDIIADQDDNRWIVKSVGFEQIKIAA